jgi:CHAT domain-containing protein/predicted Zn-dependent protease
VGGESKHLDIEQIERLLGVETGGAESAGESAELDDARRHLSSCEFCQRLVSMERESDQTLRGLRLNSPKETLGDCPPRVRFYELVSGLVGEEDSEKLMSHAAECGHCGPVLRQVTEDLASERTVPEEAALESLMTSQPKWQEAFAKRLASESVAEKGTVPAVIRERGVGPSRQLYGWAFALGAAVVLFALVVGTIAWRSRAGYAESLIAEAYSQRRTLEFRIPNARYAPLRMTRGSQTSNLDKPSSLLRAESLIGTSLEKHPENVNWLQAKARADLLDGSYESAIKTLRRALELDPDGLALLTDLASAYSQRGEERGQPADYGEAIELLGRVLARRPDDRVALYNRAIVSERAFLYKQAQADLERYLRIDPVGDWADDAHHRLELLREKTKDHDSRSSRPLLGFAGFAIARNPDSNDFANLVDTRFEDYMDQATSEWLPVAYETAFHQENQKSEARAAAEFLARLSISKHEDPWLSDLLSGSRAHHFPQAIAALSQSIKANKAGDYLSARIFASQAERLFETDRDEAGVLRARVENMFALHLSHEGQACLKAGDRWAREIESSPYRWIQSQFGFEYGMCKGITGKYGESLRSIDAAMEQAKDYGYKSAYLRGLGFASDLASTLGNVRNGWANAHKGLTAYWSGTFRPMLGYNLYTDLDTAADARKQPYLQVAIWEQALGLLDSDNDPLLRGMAHAWMAKAAIAANMRDVAAKEFMEASRWFAAAPQNDATRNDQVEVETLLAQLEAQRGDRDGAVERLSRIKPAIESLSNHYLAIRYYAVRGGVESGPDDAERSLRAAVALAEQNLQSLGSDRERSVWNEEVSEAYRNLIQVKLQRGDAETGLEIWEWYKGAPIRFGEHGNGGVNSLETTSVEGDLGAAALAQGPSLPSLNEVARLLPSLQNETVISYGVFGESVWILAFDDKGVLARKAELSASEIATLANRFADLCSNPDSDRSALRRDGLKLYELLVEPVEQKISARKNLVFELDRAMARIPMEAILDRSATYLVDRFTIAVSPGLYYKQVVRPSVGISAQTEALVVAVPAPGGAGSDGMMPLMDAVREAESVAKSFRTGRVLQGSDATLATVGNLMRRAQVFHFSGHAKSSEGKVGLVLAGVDLENRPKLLDAAFIDGEKLERMQLAVLSACATESTESGAQTEDDLGLAFMRGGVPYVVGSRWNVDSSATTAVMQTFYRALFSGEDVSESLRGAEVALRSRAEFTHPYYWASFEVLRTP